MKIGYIRVSTQEQNTIRQEVMMEQLGVEELYIDKASGKNTDRPELKKMMAYVRRGDTVIVESISRFARNTRDLLELIEQLTAKGVEFISKKEAIDTSTPQASSCSLSLVRWQSWSGSTFYSARGRGLKLLSSRGSTRVENRYRPQGSRRW